MKNAAVMSAEALKVEKKQFSTAFVRARDRYDAWQASISDVTDVSPSAGTDLATFRASVEGYMIGSLLTVYTQTKVQNFERSKTLIAREGVDHIVAVLSIHGNSNLITNGEGHLFRAGDIKLIDLAQTAKTTHELQDNYLNGLASDISNLSLVIARDRIEQFMPSAHVLHGKYIPNNTPLNLVLKNYMLSLFQAAPDMSAIEGHTLSKSSAELFASSFSQLPGVLEETRSSVDTAVLLTVRKFIDTHLDSPELNAEYVAKKLGLSASGLYRLCKHLGGVGAMIRDRRLFKARRMLSNTSTKVSIKEVAYTLGYSNPANFTRAYRKAFGFSPSDTHDMYIETQRYQNSTVEPYENAREFNFWMKNLVG